MRLSIQAGQAPFENRFQAARKHGHAPRSRCVGDRQTSLRVVFVIRRLGAGAKPAL